MDKKYDINNVEKNKMKFLCLKFTLQNFPFWISLVQTNIIRLQVYRMVKEILDGPYFALN